MRRELAALGSQTLTLYAYGKVGAKNAAPETDGPLSLYWISYPCGLPHFNLDLAGRPIHCGLRPR